MRFSPLIRLDVTKYVLLIVFILIETICPKGCSKSQLKCAKSLLPVDVRRSKTLLLKLLVLLKSYEDARRAYNRQFTVLPRFPNMASAGWLYEE